MNRRSLLLLLTMSVTVYGKADSYMIIDVSGGIETEKFPVEYIDEIPKGGWTEEHKTSKIVLRQINAGSFTMGRPINEVGAMKYLQEYPYSFDAVEHCVIFTEDFYIGVFEVTQRQWELVMGTRPSWFSKDSAYPLRPVENVSYHDIRGTDAPTTAAAVLYAGDNSFVGVLRRKTGLSFDLPTEAQWEYSCRAGIKTSLNSGHDLTSMSIDSSAATVARYRGNSGYAGRISRDWEIDKGTSEVGYYSPNAWGLYDMHGNVREWCLDAMVPLTTNYDTINPLSSTTAYAGNIVIRGGGWVDYAHALRSANRHDFAQADHASAFCGFRIACESSSAWPAIPDVSYAYDDDNRLTQVTFGDSEGGIRMEISPASNTMQTEAWRAEQ